MIDLLCWLGLCCMLARVDGSGDYAIIDLKVHLMHPYSHLTSSFGTVHFCTATAWITSAILCPRTTAVASLCMACRSHLLT